MFRAKASPLRPEDYQRLHATGLIRQSEPDRTILWYFIMNITSILDCIDNGHMALPEFQRGYVWGREQVRGLFHSLYRGHPVGSLLVWATSASTAAHRGNGELAPGVVKLLLDGQQRITSLYGVIRGEPPKFFDGNARSFTELRFNGATEECAFYEPVKVRGGPLGIDGT